MSTEGQGTASRFQSFRWLLPWLMGALATSLFLTAVDHQGAPLSAFLGYLVVALVGSLALAFGWKTVGGSQLPRTVTLALLAAISLRLGVGLFLFQGLPRYGYNTDANQQGYVFYDAFARDTDAWARGRSVKPLWTAFQERKASDQYGGLLFLSAGIYRYLSEGHHRPLMVVLLAAAISSLAVLFTWGFAAMSLGTRAATWAAWAAALYPDYVLLGASQMREAFTIPAIAIALYGYARLRVGDPRGGLALFALSSALALYFSPPLALLLVLLIGAIWLVDGAGSGRANLGMISFVGLLALVALGLILQAWSGLRGLPEAGPFGILAQWLMRGAAVQLAFLEESSGWIQALFDQLPVWSHLPVATAYGLTRPFLPAAIGDRGGLPIWRGIAIWRAFGWTLLAPPLLYGALAAFGAERRRRLLLILAAVVWLGAVAASFRAAGDMWDNPRYRTAMLPLQVTLAGWAWVRARRAGSRWLRRAYYLVLGGDLIFLHWYIGRYYGTPRLSLTLTLAALGLFALTVIPGNWLLDRWRARPQPG